MYSYGFVVNYLDENFEGNHNLTIRQGVTVANSYKEAIDNLVARYGEDEIIDVHIQYLDEQNVIELSKDEFERVKKEMSI